MTGQAARWGVGKRPDGDAPRESLRLGHYLPDEDAHWQPAGYRSGRSADDGIFVKTDGHLCLSADRNVFLDFRNGHAIVVRSGDKSTVVGGLSSLIAQGIVVQAGPPPEKPFSESVGVGSARIKTPAGKILLQAPAANAAIMVTAANRLTMDVGATGAEYYYGPSSQSVFGGEFDFVIISDLGITLLGNSSIEFSRWRFRVVDAKWAISVLKLLGMKVGYNGVKDEKAAASTVLYQMANAMTLTVMNRIVNRVRKVAANADANGTEISTSATEVSSGGASNEISGGDLRA